MQVPTQRRGLGLDLVKKLKVAQRALKRSLLGVYQRDRNRNEEICRQTKVRHNPEDQQVELAVGTQLGEPMAFEKQDVRRGVLRLDGKTT